MSTATITPTAVAPATTVGTDELSQRVMRALGRHVPLTLLIDLTAPTGPASAEIAAQEGGSADWLGH